jgi:hypothetical protein
MPRKKLPTGAPGVRRVLRQGEVADLVVWLCEHKAEMEEAPRTWREHADRVSSQVDLDVSPNTLQTLCERLGIEVRALAQPPQFRPGYSAPMQPALAEPDPEAVQAMQRLLDDVERLKAEVKEQKAVVASLEIIDSEWGEVRNRLRSVQSTASDVYRHGKELSTLREGLALLRKSVVGDGGLVEGLRNVDGHVDYLHRAVSHLYDKLGERMPVPHEEQAGGPVDANGRPA